MNIDIKERLTAVNAEINSCCKSAGRPRQDVTLLAVSKLHPSSMIREAYACGQRCFGENYLQESSEKIAELADLDIEWHFIGPIQSNKTRHIAELFHWVHSVDRLKIATRLSEQRPTELPPLNICLQVNISREESKAGCLPEEAAALARQMAALPNIKLRGLMAIPQATDDETRQHAAFAALRQLKEQLQAELPELDTLSMGMSGDLDAAVEEGSTLVRIGTAIFGPRPAQHA